MMAATANHRRPRPVVSQMIAKGARAGLRVGAQMGLARFGVSCYEQMQPLTGVTSWGHWLLQSENTLLEWLRSLNFSQYFKNAASDGFFAFLRSFFESICTELIVGHFPWLEKHLLYQLEYLWRGIQGRTIRPPAPVNLDVAATSVVLVDYQQWAPICHPAVEYAKPSTLWSPRMFAACESSKFAIPAISTFLVGAGFDIVSYSLGHCSTRKLVTRLWKDFYAGVGAFVGTGAFAALWSVCSHKLLPLFPVRAHSVLPGLVPQIGMSVGSYVMISLVFNSFWHFDDDDELLPSFADGAALERQRRIVRYGPYKSLFARPPELAPVAPEFIDPELNEEFIRECFPEKLPQLLASKVAVVVPVPEPEEDPSNDPGHALRVELHRARALNATASRPVSALPSRTVTPTGSRYNSDDEESTESSSSESEDSSSEEEESSQEEASQSESESESEDESTEESDESDENSDEDSE